MKKTIKPKQISGHNSDERADDPKLEIDLEGNILSSPMDWHVPESEAEYESGHHHEERDSSKKHENEHELHGSEREDEPRSKVKSLEGNEQSKPDKEDHIPDDFDALKKLLEKQVGLNQSFDVVFREMIFGGHKTGIFYYNGFAKDTVLTMILDRMSDAEINKHTIHNDHTESPVAHQERGGKGQDMVQLFMDAIIPHNQVKQTDKLSEVIDNVSMGASGFFFEGATSAIIVDAKSFPVRSTEEPDLERVVRGSRDGFVETLLTNVTLLRRRIRDPKLKLEMLRVGRRTHTDICMAYIDDICDPQLVESIRDKIHQVDVDGLPLAEKQLEEAIVGRGWNPYPMVRYSERPDIVSVHLLEGHVALFVDTSPSVIILPTTFFHHVQHAEEYRQTPAVGTYLRWVRFIGIAASIFLLPLWFLLVTSPELKPAGLEFLGPQKNGKLPLLSQFLVAELGIDLMRMAAVHTPSPLATAMGLVAAILVGDVAVKTGLFVNEVILYLSIAAVGTFATPSYELSLANRLARLALLVLTAVFKIPGLIIGFTVLALYLVTRRSYNAPYMWPLIPFNAKALNEILIRRPFLARKNRMSLTRPSDNTRQPK